eukprot:27394-Eustigmatos_ZCMA.PRE.1
MATMPQPYAATVRLHQLKDALNTHLYYLMGCPAVELPPAGGAWAAVLVCSGATRCRHGVLPAQQAAFLSFQQRPAHPPEPQSL